MHIDGEFELHDDVALLRRMPFVASVTLVPPLHPRPLDPVPRTSPPPTRRAWTCFSGSAPCSRGATTPGSA